MKPGILNLDKGKPDILLHKVKVISVSLAWVAACTAFKVMRESDRVAERLSALKKLTFAIVSY